MIFLFFAISNLRRNGFKIYMMCTVNTLKQKFTNYKNVYVPIDEKNDNK